MHQSSPQQCDFIKIRVLEVTLRGIQEAGDKIYNLIYICQFITN